MEGVLISGLILLLRQPGLIPGMEEEREKLLHLLPAIQHRISYSDEDDAGVVRTRLGDAEEDDAGVVRTRLGDAEEDDADDVRTRLSDAEEDDSDVRSWLSDLKAVAYDADDIVDEFKYAEFWAEAEIRRHLNREKVSNYSIKLPFFKVKGGASRGLKGVGNRFGSVVNRISDLAQRMQGLDFKEGPQVIAAAERCQQLIFSSSAETGAIVVGRDEEKENIVHCLLDSSNTARETLFGIFIVGFAGIGKTTLARYVCNDARINDHFECVLWVDGRDKFNIAKFSKSIIDQAIGKIVAYLKMIQIYYSDAFIKNSVGRGPYECLLQDLKPDDLLTLFFKRALSDPKEIGPEIRKIGREIIGICGKSLLYVNLMGGLMRFKKKPEEWRGIINQWIQLYEKEIPFPIFKLCYNNLSSEIKQCFSFCSLFPVGHYMGKEVLIKLWMANGLLSSDESTSAEEMGESIFNELALRQFFEDVKLADGGKNVKQQEYHSGIVCKMPRAVHDFSRYVSRNEYNQLDDHHVPQTSQIRYLSLRGDLQIEDFHRILEKYPNVRTLMSPDDPFIRKVNCSASLPKPNSLRALHLRSSLFDRDLLDLENVIHLRYLDLSGSRIKILPESTCSLYNLQTLNLSKCLLLYQLPENMRYMRSLRHLHVHNCPKLKRMPAHLRELSYLQTLSAYIVGEHSGNGIDEIRGLNLGGLLELYGLCKVKDAAKAKDAGLVLKRKLESLTLCWGRNRLIMSKGNNDLEVLETLQPHNGLKVLKIQQYGDPKFATWLADPVGLKSLVELHLIGCSQCKTLPSEWRLSSLQVLCLKHLTSLICMSSFTLLSGKNREGSSEMFPNLKRLVLVGLTRLERWQEEETPQRTMLEFSLLDEMEIINCPKLITMPHVSKLKYLTLSVENHRLLRSAVTQSENLVEANFAKACSADNESSLSFGEEVEWHNNHKLQIMRLDTTNSFFMPRTLPHSLLGFWRSLVRLENLGIFNCKSLVAWPLEEFRKLNKLKRLSIRMCPNLTGLLPDQFEEGEMLLPRLQALEFYGCPSLEEVPRCASILYLELDECPEIKSISGLNNLEMLDLSCTNWTSLPSGFEDLKNLKSLRVSECYGLTCLPGELEHLKSLQTFVINKCPRVESLPGGLDRMCVPPRKLQISECPILENGKTRND